MNAFRDPRFIQIPGQPTLAGTDASHVEGHIAESYALGLSVMERIASDSRGDLVYDAADVVALGYARKVAMRQGVTVDVGRQYARAAGWRTAADIAADSNAPAGLDPLTYRLPGEYMAPRRPMTVTESIAPITIPDGVEQATWSIRKHLGAIAAYRAGVTETPLTRTALEEGDRRPMHTLFTAVRDDWHPRMTERLSDPNAGAMRISNAIAALEEGEDRALTLGLDGLDFWCLTSGVPSLVSTTAVSYNATNAAGQDAMLADFSDFLASIRRLSGGRFRGPNTVLTSIRAQDVMGDKFARTSGLDSATGRVLDEILRRKGATMLTAEDLTDVGGTNVDMMVGYSGGERGNLARIVGMRAVPVHNYSDSQGNITIYALRTGGLIAPMGGGVHIRYVNFA